MGVYFAHGDVHGPKPNRFIWFGDVHGTKPYDFIGFGNIHGPRPYKFIGFRWAVLRSIGHLSQHGTVGFLGRSPLAGYPIGALLVPY
jgi:hypothetical protein